MKHNKMIQVESGVWVAIDWLTTEQKLAYLGYKPKT